ncbi:hypothetical protein D3C76_1744570 [compost metagenome]
MINDMLAMVFRLPLIGRIRKEMLPDSVTASCVRLDFIGMRIRWSVAALVVPNTGDDPSSRVKTLTLSLSEMTKYFFLARMSVK